MHFKAYPKFILHYLLAFMLCNCSNDTLKSNLKNEIGGLSGKPLRQKATDTLKVVNNCLSDDITILAAGGINSHQAAQEKFNNGAQLLQLYTGLVYEGPSLLKEILKKK